jgi:hypothetical protein
MAADYESKEKKGGVTSKLYRGEGMGLIALDLDRGDATDEFVGFSIEFRPPGDQDWHALGNRIHFDYSGERAKRAFHPSTEAPFQKYRWLHVPFEVQQGDYRYRVTPMYMGASGALTKGNSVENAISLSPETHSGVMNVGFTRGFASSQAYANPKRFPNYDKILPANKGTGELSFDTAPFQKHYEWLGFEARKLISDFLDEAVSDNALSVDAMYYEVREPDIVKRLEKLKGRLRIIIDDHGENGEPGSNESKAAKRLTQAGAEVKRMHFGRQQHNKVMILKRNGKPIRVLTGSTNFSLRGLYIQANNVLVFEADAIAKLYDDVFDAYWTDPKKFKTNPLSQKWHRVGSLAGSPLSFCFSPHANNTLSLDPVADAIVEAESSVLYAVVFLNQLTGQVRDSLDDLVNRSLFSYGVAQRTGGLSVVKPDGSRGLLPFAYIAKKAPQPFKREWSGGEGNMVHHKFVVTDFNGASPKVFTGSSNLAAGGELANGDNMILIEDRKVAIAYGIEALRLFDHFHFRVNLKEGDEKREKITLQKPPRNRDEKTWFASYYVNGHIKERDRKLFIR